MKLTKDQEFLFRYVLVDYLKTAIHETQIEMQQREHDQPAGDLPDSWELSDLAMRRLKFFGLIDYQEANE